MQKIFIVLATAASTLLANVPMTVCACSTGQGRSQTEVSERGRPAAPDARSTSCCCGGNCCSNTDEQDPCCKKPAGQQPGKPASPRPGDQRQDEQRGASSEQQAINVPECQKTTAQPYDISLNQAEAKANAVFLNSLHSPETIQDALPVPGSFHASWQWQGNRPPPPTDLVVALQHFII